MKSSIFYFRADLFIKYFVNISTKDGYLTSNKMTKINQSILLRVFKKNILIVQNNVDFYQLFAKVLYLNIDLHD